MEILDPRVWLVAALLVLAAFGAGYAEGNHARGKADKGAQAIATVKADKQAFNQTEHWQRNTDDASELAQKNAVANRDRLAAVSSANDKLRHDLDATELYAKTSLDAATKAVATERALFDSCRAEYTGMGQEAAGHAADSLMYQQAWPK